MRMETRTFLVTCAEFVGVFFNEREAYAAAAEEGLHANAPARIVELMAVSTRAGRNAWVRNTWMTAETVIERPPMGPKES